MIFFLLGAVINIAVAWYWILFVPHVPASIFGLISFGFGDEIKERLPQYVFVRSDLFDFNEFELKNRGYEFYSVSGTEVASNGVDSAVPLLMISKAGWPIFSFEGLYFMTAKGVETSFFFFVPTPLMDHVENYYLPLKPTWPGFVVNTALYGGIPWLLFCGPFILRRYRRRKRGQCVKCGYPIGKSNVCTECGFALKRVASNAAK